MCSLWSGCGRDNMIEILTDQNMKGMRDGTVRNYVWNCRQYVACMNKCCLCSFFVVRYIDFTALLATR